jgi:diguanylate cyclase (GGDEF)-like protein
MVDLDHFKAINDTHGHQGGDVVLKETARRMRASLRPYDGVGRYGGEEFIIVLPGADVRSTRAAAERLRQYLAAEPVVLGGATLQITASFGVACTHQGDAVDMAGLIRAADAALYRAKAGGRNRVDVAVESDFPSPEPSVV